MHSRLICLRVISEMVLLQKVSPSCMTNCVFYDFATGGKQKLFCEKGKRSFIGSPFVWNASFWQKSISFYGCWIVKIIEVWHTLQIVQFKKKSLGTFFCFLWSSWQFVSDEISSLLKTYSTIPNKRVGYYIRLHKKSLLI